MTLCHQATSHYLSQSSPRSMSPYGVMGPQRVKQNGCHFAHIFFKENVWFWIFFFIIEMHSHRQILSHYHWYRKVLTKTTKLHTNEGRTFGAFWDFNSLWPSDAIWHHRSKSTLVQVMACCLTAPSHHPSQCWLIISEVLWHLPEGNFAGNAQDMCPCCEFEKSLRD